MSSSQWFVPDYTLLSTSRRSIHPAVPSVDTPRQLRSKHGGIGATSKEGSGGDDDYGVVTSEAVEDSGTEKDDDDGGGGKDSYSGEVSSKAVYGGGDASKDGGEDAFDGGDVDGGGIDEGGYSGDDNVEDDDDRPSDDGGGGGDGDGGNIYSFSSGDENGEDNGLNITITPGGRKYRRLEIARPDPRTPGVRRSKRARIAPVRRWEHEKVEYDMRRRSGKSYLIL